MLLVYVSNSNVTMPGHETVVHILKDITLSEIPRNIRCQNMKLSLHNNRISSIPVRSSLLKEPTVVWRRFQEEQSRSAQFTTQHVKHEYQEELQSKKQEWVKTGRQLQDGVKVSRAHVQSVCHMPLHYHREVFIRISNRYSDYTVLFVWLHSC